MKKIMICIGIVGAWGLHAPTIDPLEDLFLQNAKDAYIREIKHELGESVTDQKVKELFNERFCGLIQHIKWQHEFEKYTEEDMNSFLLVAMAVKNGVPDESCKDTALAISLFTTISNFSLSQSLRTMAERCRITCHFQEAYKTTLVRARTV